MKKEDNLLRYTNILEEILLEIAVPFDFHRGNSGIFWKISQEISTPYVPV